MYANAEQRTWRDGRSVFLGWRVDLGLRLRVDDNDLDDNDLDDDDNVFARGRDVLVVVRWRRLGSMLVGGRPR